MKNLLVGLVLGFLSGAAMASNYWLLEIPKGYKAVYQKQSDVLDKCINYMGSANTTLAKCAKYMEDTDGGR